MRSISKSFPTSPDRRQHEIGRTRLRFEEPLESQFRKVYLEANLTLLRGALLIGFLFGFTVLAMDYWLAEPGFTSWSVPVRAVITLPLVLAILLASFHPTAEKFLIRLATAAGFSIAATFLLLSTFAEGQTLGSAFSGYVVVTFYMYLFLSQRFWPALITSMTLFISFLAATALQYQKADIVIYGTFLMFVNLISAIALYSHENNQRKTFLHARTLNDLAKCDPLTRLANRKALDEHLDDIWSNAKQESQPIALALIDIDHFKSYNDHYGHQAGDRCLIAVAQVLRKAMRRPLDLAARFGGEEFVLLLPGLTLEDAQKVTNELRRQVQALNVPHKVSPTGAHVTISAGLAHLYPHDTKHSSQGFLQLADQAMYQAKKRGRNRVSVSGVQQDKKTETGIFQNANALKLA